MIWFDVCFSNLEKDYRICFLAAKVRMTYPFSTREDNENLEISSKNGIISTSYFVSH